MILMTVYFVISVPPPEPEKVMTPPPPPPIPQLPPPIPMPLYREPEPMRPGRQYNLDGVWVSESGLNQIRAISIKGPEKKRVRKMKSRFPGMFPGLDKMDDDTEMKGGLTGGIDHQNV